MCVVLLPSLLSAIDAGRVTMESPDQKAVKQVQIEKLN
jgi:hypothetical protein